ncbi:MmcB family DNA repair protein [Breoghania sp. L-A4]|uniref:MmcB family DNA repair protein n=1 Tax=Breoghania sp. L-A4 TaxID=2304600 RepID=UPI000E35DAED|nr:MmcB family DNA repair protein [Breoghania sp. L-A4]AXS38905.1 DNA repair protein MmcB-related protein [Breoghania sp. L-A4]
MADLLPDESLESWLDPDTPERLIDGRQSETALRVRRGVGRLIRQLGASCIAEMTLVSGRRADLVAIARTGEIWIIEVKSSLADLRADKKWPDYRDFCDRLYFATAPEVPLDPFPQDAGLMLSDGYGAEILREATLHKLAGARRKAVTLRFARMAATRLHDLMDPRLSRGGLVGDSLL